MSKVFVNTFVVSGVRLESQTIKTSSTPSALAFFLILWISCKRFSSASECLRGLEDPDG